MVDPADYAAVAELLGRSPQGDFAVVVRDRRTAAPMVISNAPFLDDGTPMPTRWWLVDPDLLRRVSQLESTGGIRRANAEVPEDAVAHAHRRYAQERNDLISPEHAGPRPSGGVAGTRIGVKCLHAHYAWFLAGGDDPVGRWVQQELDGLGQDNPAIPEAPFPP